MTTRYEGAELDMHGAVLHKPYVEKRFSHLDITGATTQNIDFAELVPAGHAVTAAIMDILTAFTSGNGNTTNLQATVGDGGSSNRYLLVANTFTVTGLTELGGAGAGLASSNGFFSATAITGRIALTATGGAPDLDDINAGEAVVRIYYESRTRPSRTAP